MYKIMFFMEDAEAVQNLTSMLPEEFFSSGSYHDVKEALDKIEQDSTDVVIIDTDVRQELGMELIRKLSKKKKSPVILMLCDYREMEYAKKASDYGVEYYLLKPVRLDEFSYAVSSIKLDLDRRNIARLQHINSLNFEQFLPMLREQFFSGLVSGERLNKDDLLEKINQLKLDIDIYRFPCAVIEVHIIEFEQYMKNNWKYGRDALYTAIKNLLNDSSRFSYQLVESNQERCRFVLIANEALGQTEFQTELDQQAGKDTASAFSLFGVILLIRPVATFANLIEFADQMRGNRELEEVLRIRHNTATETDNISKMVFCLRQSRVMDARKIAGHYMEELTTFSDKDVARFLFHMSMIVCRQMFPGDDRMRLRTIQMLKDVEHREQLKENLMQLLGEYAEAFRRNLYRSDEVVIQKAKQYISEHCQEDVSLDEVAESVFLTPVYFSRFFKDKTGENFSKFVTRMKMEKAIELFRHGKYKIYEVAKMVGYKNAKYFSKLFKEYTGFLPREYIRTVLGQEHAE